MALQVWLPLTKDLRNQGLGSVQTTNNTNFILKSGGKLGTLCLDLSNTVRLYSPNLVNLKTFSFAFWYRPETSESTINWNDVIGFNDSKGGLFRLETSYSNSYMLSMHNNTQYGIIQNVAASYGNTLLLSSASYSRDVWYHIAVTVEENDNVKAYVNGELKCIVARSDGSITGYFNLGEVGGSHKEDGGLNDLRIYDHCLSPMEVKELAKGLVLHYPLNRNGWGQENLLTKQISDPGWSNWHGTSEWATENIREKIIINGKLWAHVHQLSSSSYGGYAINPSNNGIVIDSTKRYTWSCLAKAGNDTNAEIVLWHHWRSTNGGANLSQSLKKFILTSTPTRISWTVPQYINETYMVDRINMMMGTSGTANNEIYFTDVKFEEGEIATPWCPNSSDALATTMGINSTTEYDCSGFCNNGTRTGTFTWTSNTPKYIASTIFNGSNNAIQTPNLTEMVSDKNYTIACWVYKTVLGSKNYQTIYGGPSGFELEARNGTAAEAKFRLHNWGGGSVAYDFNTWYHFCFVHTNSDSKLYINGELALTGSSAAVPSGNYFVGAWKTATQQNYDGLISDFRIYATALSADDVKSLYQNCATIDPDGTIRGQIRS